MHSVKPTVNQELIAAAMRHFLVALVTVEGEAPPAALLLCGSCEGHPEEGRPSPHPCKRDETSCGIVLEKTIERTRSPKPFIAADKAVHVAFQIPLVPSTASMTLKGSSLDSVMRVMGRTGTSSSCPSTSARTCAPTPTAQTSPAVRVSRNMKKDQEGIYVYISI